MSIKMISPVGKKVMNIREADVQLYLERGYKYVEKAVELETIEIMSPAGKVVVLKSDINNYLQREGWSLLEPEPLIEDETPVEDKIPVLPIDEVSVEESETVETDIKITNDIPEGAEEANAEMEE